ncbi:hypothetical protein ACHAXT_011717 [Thalassiosira profunda]
MTSDAEYQPVLSSEGDGDQGEVAAGSRSHAGPAARESDQISMRHLIPACAFVVLCFFAGYRGGLRFQNGSVDIPDATNANDNTQEHHKMRAPERSRMQNGEGPLDPVFREINLDSAASTNLSPTDQTLLGLLAQTSYARHVVVDLLSKEYVGPDVAPDERFEDAVEAVQLAETDGEPVAVTGHPFLFVGSVGAAMNREGLERAGITHIINWSKTSRCNVHPGIEYMCITNVSNYKDMNNHLDVLDEVVEFIEKARREGGRALSQCWYGRNRSVTTLVAYLMKYSDMTGNDALKLIQKTRPIADSYRDTVRYYNRQYVKPMKKKRANAAKAEDGNAMAKTEGSK